jgi:hypothetical protein
MAARWRRDFDAQFHQVFGNIGKILADAGRR